MTEIICAVVTTIGAIIIAIIGLLERKEIKRQKQLEEETEKRRREFEEKNEQRAKLRQKESLLSLKMMDATLQLSVVTSNALTGGHNNGNVERAREAAENVAKEYDDFMRGITAHEIGK